MNDPNGLVYVNESGTGYYHLYYQFNPYCSQWDNMHWGHSKSTDLLHWEHFLPAIYRFQKGHIFSGSVVYDPNGTAHNGTYDDNTKKEGPQLVAFFTTSKTYQNTKNYNTYGTQHNLLQLVKILLVMNSKYIIIQHIILENLDVNMEMNI